MRGAYIRLRYYSNILCIVLLIAGADLHLQKTPDVYRILSSALPTDCGSTTTVNICATSAVLNADGNQSNYLWSTGETTQSITVTANGIYSWETIDLANNQVVNGYFTDGNSGFGSDYTYVAPTGSTGSFGALSSEGYYSVATNPKATHTNFSSFADHTGNTTGTRSMMVINGATTAGVGVWKESITVQPNTDYIYSIWFTSVYAANPGQLAFSINNVPLGNPIILTPGTPDWKNFAVRWNSGNNTRADIAILNQNTIQNGNDFAIDDIVFAPVCKKFFDVKLYANPPKPTITSQ